MIKIEDLKDTVNMPVGTQFYYVPLSKVLEITEDDHIIGTCPASCIFKCEAYYDTDKEHKYCTGKKRNDNRSIHYVEVKRKGKYCIGVNPDVLYFFGWKIDVIKELEIHESNIMVFKRRNQRLYIFNYQGKYYQIDNDLIALKESVIDAYKEHLKWLDVSEKSLLNNLDHEKQHKEWLQGLKKGDIVIVIKYALGRKHRYKSSVKSLTKESVCVDGDHYSTKTGVQIISGGPEWPFILEQPTQKILDEIEHDKLFSKILKSNLKRCSLEDLRKINEILGGES